MSAEDAADLEELREEMSRSGGCVYGLVFLPASCREFCCRVRASAFDCFVLRAFVVVCAAACGCRDESEIDTWVGREVLGGVASQVLLC